MPKPPPKYDHHYGGTPFPAEEAADRALDLDELQAIHGTADQGLYEAAMNGRLGYADALLARKRSFLGLGLRS
eukprot:6832014-Alexandrium_andersonii.AAC.1